MLDEQWFLAEWVRAYHIFAARGYPEYEAAKQAALHARSREQYLTSEERAHG